MVGQYDEGRQIVVHAAEPVADPAPHPREARPVEAGGLQIGRLRVHAGLADHIVHEGHVVHHLAERRHRLAEHLPALAMRLELPRAKQVIQPIKKNQLQEPSMPKESRQQRATRRRRKELEHQKAAEEEEFSRKQESIANRL